MALKPNSMDNQKHTPGPWKIGKLIVRPLTYAFNVYRTIYINGKTIAKVYGDQVYDAELIARAPELLQENERLKQELKDEIQYRKDQVAEIQRDAAREINKYRQ